MVNVFLTSLWYFTYTDTAREIHSRELYLFFTQCCPIGVSHAHEEDSVMPHAVPTTCQSCTSEVPTYSADACHEQYVRFTTINYIITDMLVTEYGHLYFRKIGAEK